MSGELHVQNLGKSYRQWGSELRRVASWFMPSILPREEHWVLKDVSFSVGSGEAVGIVGQNGAGKSTLLKLIAGTTVPTQGKVQVRGRVAAILELGMGFNPDLTGRQNAYHSAGLMGYSQADIERIMPEIEAFAEVGKYFDQAVRTYSSGMQMRVAFGVAIAKRPDILIVDEALAVGDIRFQQKCFERIEQYKKAGTTLIFVSHDLNIIYRFCDKALLISEGTLAAYGDVRYVSSKYEAILKGKDTDTHRQIIESASNPVTGSEISIKSNFFSHLTISGKVSGIPNILREGETAKIKIRLINLLDYDDPHVGFQIRDRMGVIVFETNTYCIGYRIAEHQDKNGHAELHFELKVNLARGVYSISFDIANRGSGAGFFEEVVALKEYVQELVVVRESGIQWDGICNLYPRILSST